MLNTADLSSLVVVFAGTIAGLAGPREENAGVVMTLLFVLGGFLVSLILARVSHALACAIQRSKRLPAGVGMVLDITLCGLSPFVIGLGILGLSMLLARCVL